MFFKKKRDRKQKRLKQSEHEKQLKKDNDEILAEKKLTEKILTQYESHPKQSLIPKDVILLQKLRNDLLRSGALNDERKKQVMKAQTTEELESIFEAAKKEYDPNDSINPDAYDARAEELVARIAETTDHETVNTSLQEFDEPENQMYDRSNVNSTDNKTTKDNDNKELTKQVLSSGFGFSKETNVRLPDGNINAGKIV